MTGSTKRIAFLTGTRADFGKLKPLISAVEEDPSFEYVVFATGMHLMSRYGLTVNEIYKAGYENVFTFMNQIPGEPMELALSNTISGLSRYVHEHQPDLIIVHGDRVEALAGAATGALRNILVGHVEGGEVSGTVDETLRHATSKLAHIHFATNDRARRRLLQLGETEDSIFVIGSPDIDVMLSADLPTVDEAKKRYEIGFDEYALALYHPVTTERDHQAEHAREFVDALIQSRQNYILIYPNNDEGSDEILKAYERLQENPRFKVFPSLRFEFFLSLLSEAQFVVGNSSAGMHEAPVYGIPTVDIGTRQRGRFEHPTIVRAEHDPEAIVAAIDEALRAGRGSRTHHYGRGDSAERFMEALRSDRLWAVPAQKAFVELEF